MSLMIHIACERVEVWERSDHTIASPGEDGAEVRSILGRTVPTCPVHGTWAKGPE